MITIEKIDEFECRIIDPQGKRLIYEMLAYKKDKWVKNKYNKQKIEFDTSFLNKKTGKFPAGFLPRIISNLDRQKIPFELIDNQHNQVNFNKPHLPGIVFRPDQLELLEKVSRLHRGYLKSATGTGKTLLAAGIHSMIDGRTLFLCHTIDLLVQAFETFRNFGFQAIMLGGGEKNLPNELDSRVIIVSTVQTWIKIAFNSPDKYSEKFTAIIIDEVHHLSSQDSNYAKILEINLAPVRVGLTATDQTSSTSRMVLEAWVGPLIGEFTVEQGIKAGVLSEPQIQWINVPDQQEIYRLTNYRDIYKEAIIDSRIRNRLIIMEAIKETSQGKSVLILVKEVEHAKKLLEMADILGLEINFVWSETNKDERMKLKQALESKEKKCIIASTVWKEGVNIRSLDCVINAAGGKSEIATLQGIGRGLRATTTKNKVIIKDFIDTYKYLDHHTMMRLQVYVENKWEMRGI